MRASRYCSYCTGVYRPLNRSYTLSCAVVRDASNNVLRLTDPASSWNSRGTRRVFVHDDHCWQSVAVHQNRWVDAAVLGVEFVDVWVRRGEAQRGPMGSFAQLYHPLLQPDRPPDAVAAFYWRTFRHDRVVVQPPRPHGYDDELDQHQHLRRNWQ